MIDNKQRIKGGFGVEEEEEEKEGDLYNKLFGAGLQQGSAQEEIE